MRGGSRRIGTRAFLPYLDDLLDTFARTLAEG